MSSGSQISCVVFDLEKPFKHHIKKNIYQSFKYVEKLVDVSCQKTIFCVHWGIQVEISLLKIKKNFWTQSIQVCYKFLFPINHLGIVSCRYTSLCDIIVLSCDLLNVLITSNVVLISNFAFAKLSVAIQIPSINLRQIK